MNKRYALMILLALSLWITAHFTLFRATDALLMRLMRVPEANFLIQFYSGTS